VTAGHLSRLWPQLQRKPVPRKPVPLPGFQLPPWQLPHPLHQKVGATPASLPPALADQIPIAHVSLETAKRVRNLVAQDPIIADWGNGQIRLLGWLGMQKITIPSPPLDAIDVVVAKAIRDLLDKNREWPWQPSQDRPTTAHHIRA
jgi:hypothetical protein